MLFGNGATRERNRALAKSLIKMSNTEISVVKSKSIIVEQGISNLCRNKNSNVSNRTKVILH